MSKTASIFALVCALVGLGVSVEASRIHYNLLNNPSYTSFCDVSATVSCSQVYSSRYGSVGGVPVAVFGAIWFGFAALLSLAGLTARDSIRESVPGYLFAGSTLALSVILYLGYASFVILKMVCILCVITYAAVIALFFVSGAVSTVPMMSLPRRMSQDLKVLIASPMALALALLFIGGAASTLAFFPRDSVMSVAAATEAAAAPASAAAAEPAVTQDQRSDFEKYYTSQPRMNLVIPNDGAKVLVVKFNDYQCPPCRQSYLDYKSVFAKYAASHPGQVKLVLRDFPLEAECNSSVTTSMHPAGCEAAVAARLAREQNRVEPFEEWIFANQQAATRESVKQAVRDIANVQNFDARYDTLLEQVKADIAYGRTLGVRSTPTFFINGVKIEGALPAVYFDQAIAYELARSK
jgi:protein-disulfide isomerase